MIRNYFKIAFRRLFKNKLYTLVNFTGLSVGIASCMLIGLFIINDLSYDRFQKNGDNIVRMVMQYGEGGKQITAVCGTKTGPQLRRTFPQVKGYARLINSDVVVKYGNVIFDEKRFLFADSSFFSMFSFPLLRGNTQNVLDAPRKVVLSASTAKKYFGNEDPIGKTLRVNDAKDYEVTGIVADAPENSQIKYDFIASFSSTGAYSRPEEWFSANYTTYLLLKDQTPVKSFQSQLNNYMLGVSKNELNLQANSPLQYMLEPMLKVHLYSPYSGLEPNGNIVTVYVLGIIALLILVIACINYTNLATVQSGTRSTEIGIRKVLGAQKTQLFNQFIGESFLLTFLSLIMAVVVTILFLPYFNQITGKELSLMTLVKPVPVLVFLILCVIIAFAAGGYPAFVLSGARLINILKSGLQMTSSGGAFRQSLIVFQFFVSIFLIVSTIIILQQLSYIRNKNLGYDRDHVLVLPIGQQIQEHYEAVKTEIGRLPQVASVSGANAEPVFVRWGDGITGDNGHNKFNLDIKALPCDIGFLKTMNMQLVAGSDFTRADLALADTSDHDKNFRYAFILNETAVKALGWTPEEAIGKTVYKGKPGIVKGVVKDFYFSSLHDQVGPLMLFLDRQFTNYYFVKVSGENIPATLQSLEKLWKERSPSQPFEYSFLDDDYNSLYKTEQKTATLFSTFSTLAIVLACLGLFGLAAFTTTQRTKEIGIRKVLGADVSTIMLLIAKDFLKLTAFAVLIASPVAWYFMHRWLQDFAYHISIQWWVFVLAGGAAVLIAFITVSMQSIKAALANPVKSLRSE